MVSIVEEERKCTNKTKMQCAGGVQITSFKKYKKSPAPTLHFPSQDLVSVKSSITDSKFISSPSTSVPTADQLLCVNRIST